VKQLMKAVLIAAMLAPLTASALFRCKDEKGFTHIGSVPPPECANVPIFEVTSTGTVLRKIEPTPTPEQLKAKQAEEAKAKEAARLETDKKRKDQILLTTYTSEAEFDRARDNALQSLAKTLEANATRMKAVDKRQKELEDELEFYKAGTGKGKAGTKGREPPAQLTSDIAGLKKERTVLEEANARTEKEMQAVRDRFEADKARWNELRQPKK
jgi:hypothetical protein